MATHVRLLGRPAIHHDDGRLEPPRGKTAALLLYLAYQTAWSSRDELLDLLWPDTLEARARGNLRSLLSRSVKRLPYVAGLEIDSTRLRWYVPSDVQAFKQALHARQWLRAVQLYGGEFLQGFWLDDAAEFERWLETERHALHTAWRDAVFNLASTLEVGGQWAQATEALGQLCRADPFDEEALRRYAHMLHASGQRGKALAAFETFRRGLERELGGEPEPATLQLVEDIGRAAPGRPLPRGVPAETPTTSENTTSRKARHNLPAPATPLVGRQAERARLAALLTDGTCRLATLVGPGGVGKTRLALAAAQEQREVFEDGVWFVPCTPVRDPELLVYAVAEALSLPLIGPAAPKVQLLEFLRPKAMLLVLDNLEQLLPDIGLIRDMLEVAPGVKVLATSRERLNLQVEHVVDLVGLPIPEEDAQGGASYDAVRLFVQCASRSRGDFVLDKTNQRAVVRICRLVEGLPLAIELAAGWLRVVSAAEIASEIERGIDILRTPMQDVPERHQSIRAVFDYSWRVLTAEEQGVLKKLAVFQGGFAREAAEHVAGAGLAVLAGLVNKSFVSTTPSGRYHLHPLVQQYLWEKLADTPDDEATVKAAHGTYYTDFLDERRQDLIGGRQLDATREIAAEFDNIRTAWRWALNGRPQHLDRQARPLATFYMYQSRYQEWLASFREAAEHLLIRDPTEEADLALVFLLTHLGWCNHRLGRLDDAEKAARQSQAIYRRLGIPPVPGPATDPVLVLGLLACVQGDYPAAAQYGKQALRTSETHGHLHNQCVAHHVLARAALGRQQFAVGERHAQKSYALARQIGDRWHMSNCHIELGHGAYALGDDAAAQRHYRNSYLICEEFDDKGGMAKALNELGELALRRQAYAEAQATFRQSLALNDIAREGKGLAKALCGLGDAALALGELDAASAYYRQTLELAAEMRSQPLLLRVVQGVCRLLSLAGHEARAQRLVSELRLPPAFADIPGDQEGQAFAYMGEARISLTGSAEERGAALVEIAAAVAAELAALARQA